ncbi:nucleoid-associated protein [Pleionea mediterranea]|jgi:nucleoid-associated protein|uniref:Nucleoid-associated protein YejK n=1 Tax=Pleionea mediterranea TaxID=523701 RepID=A0A316F8P0_9GAMM|nr:nucleoid-associated protein [Pleionea mediterranea]PWK43619.1 nucleoid-associated protein YejK [Pleionea mediterranea]
MTIKHCSIHKLQRSKPGSEAKIQLRPDEVNAEGPIVSLFEQLKLTFQRSTQKQYGLFDPEQSDNPLPALLKNHESDSISFSSLTHQAMDHLKLQFEKTPEPMNSHILFVMDELVEQQFFYVFWINHTDAQFINNELDVDTLEYINPAKLNFAFKIDMEQWKVEGWDQYLSFIASKGNKELTEAFKSFAGFISSVDLKAQTEDFLSVVDDYIDQQEPTKGEQLKSKIVEYCIDQDMSGAPVDLDDLSTQLDDDNPAQFSSFVSENKPEVKKEIYTDRASLKKYVRFFGRDKNLSISFSSEMFGDNIVFDEDSDELIVKHIPKSLKAQLTRYIKRKQSS